MHNFSIYRRGDVARRVSTCADQTRPICPNCPKPPFLDCFAALAMTRRCTIQPFATLRRGTPRLYMRCTIQPFAGLRRGTPRLYMRSPIPAICYVETWHAASLHAMHNSAFCYVETWQSPPAPLKGVLRLRCTISAFCYVETWHAASLHAPTKRVPIVPIVPTVPIVPSRLFWIASLRSQ